MGRVTLRLGGGLLTWLIVLLALLPVFWTILSSFKSLRDIVSPIPVLVFQPTLENYRTVLTTPAVRDGLVNSIIVVGSALLIGVVLGVPAAYALARFVRRLKGDIQFFVLSLRFMPPVAVALPFIALWLDLGLYDTLIAVIVTYCIVTISTIIWLGVPAFEQVPRAIEEAAALEGYGPFAVFWKVALPVAAPSLVGAVLFTFVITWNELLIALALTSRNVTLPVVAAGFTTLGMEVPWGVINASSVVLALPPLILVGLIMRFIDRYFSRPAR
ncbi:carbohydrate ABC transporter permease [Geminicoccus harenae]|uniref:carbohydrate ABC transporter permease n=1 Tax=Geminicoccus harenae TaxID=2498453 RepID=UPI00168A6E48|nr:carbohydrate ABC transporter permease [Geminicoccus harenae]